MSHRFYSFDTSVLINGRRDLLPPDIFGGVWERIERLIGEGSIRCVDVVRDELERKDDATKAWADAQTELFVALEQDIQVATRKVLRDHPRLTGKGGRRNLADPFVIGLAHARGGTVVTEESMSGRLARPRIPDVCAAMNVPCVGLVGFIREQGWSFA